MIKATLLCVLLLLAAAVDCPAEEVLDEEAVRRQAVYEEEGRRWERIQVLEAELGTPALSAETCLELARLYSISSRGVSRTIRLYFEASRPKPDDPELLSLFAELFFRERQYQDLARELAAQALLLAPDNTAALTVLAECRLEDNQLEEAAGLLERALAGKPDQARPYLLKAELLYGEKDFAAAREYLQQARSRLRPEDTRLETRIASRLKNLEEISNLEELVESGRAVWEDYQRLSRILSHNPYRDRRSLQAEGLAIFKDAAEKVDKPWLAYWEIGRILSQLKDYESAREALLKALELARQQAGPEEQRDLRGIALDLARVYFSLGEYEKAIQTHLLNFGPRWGPDCRFLGRAYYQLGDYWKAVAAYRAGRDVSGEARALRALSDYGAARNLLWGAIREKPRKGPVDEDGRPVKNLAYEANSRLYRELGQTYREMNQPAKAILAYWEAYKIDRRGGSVIEELMSGVGPAQAVAE